jgi:hypothetical protein
MGSFYAKYQCVFSILLILIKALHKSLIPNPFTDAGERFGSDTEERSDIM